MVIFCYSLGAITALTVSSAMGDSGANPTDRFSLNDVRTASTVNIADIKELHTSSVAFLPFRAVVGLRMAAGLALFSLEKLRINLFVLSLSGIEGIKLIPEEPFFDTTEDVETRPEVDVVETMAQVD